ncbi:MAG: hypothetical protein QOG25_2529 [Acetobacteraceae bacterium]|jgi:hypothetical protein|nr:hypothetical protein [Acetobacteraceae bacterium]
MAAYGPPKAAIRNGGRQIGNGGQHVHKCVARPNIRICTVS